VQEGAQMINRGDASGAGLHFPIVAGMAGAPVGTSFVHLGSYGGDDSGDTLTYIGHGGADLKKNLDGSKANKKRAATGKTPKPSSSSTRSSTARPSRAKKPAP
jgi:hypothetical protein